MSVVLTPHDVHSMGHGVGEMHVPDIDLYMSCRTMEYADLSSMFPTPRKGHGKDFTLITIVVVIVQFTVNQPPAQCPLMP